MLVKATNTVNRKIERVIAHRRIDLRDTQVISRTRLGARPAPGSPARGAHIAPLTAVARLEVSVVSVKSE